MLLIVVTRGAVTAVIDIGKKPDVRPDVLEPKKDYMVEYYGAEDEWEGPPF
jgi:hypothetical protein